MLAQRLERCPNTRQTLLQCLLCAGEATLMTYGPNVDKCARYDAHYFTTLTIFRYR